MAQKKQKMAQKKQKMTEIQPSKSRKKAEGVFLCQTTFKAFSIEDAFFDFFLRFISVY
jgi:hypothetical protein